jgi:hypothetical protein
VGVRDRINQGSLPGPRILTSVRQINERSGTPDEIRALVRQTKAEGDNDGRRVGRKHKKRLDTTFTVQ